MQPIWTRLDFLSSASWSHSRIPQILFVISFKFTRYGSTLSKPFKTTTEQKSKGEDNIILSCFCWKSWPYKPLVWSIHRIQAAPNHILSFWWASKHFLWNVLLEDQDKDEKTIRNGSKMKLQLSDPSIQNLFWFTNWSKDSGFNLFLQLAFCKNCLLQKTFMFTYLPWLPISLRSPWSPFVNGADRDFL